MSVFAQNNIVKLDYAKTMISIPQNCVAKSEYEIMDCNGFTAQWLYLEEEMASPKVLEKLILQIEEQFDYAKKKPLKFISQKQSFDGAVYEMKDKEIRILGYGRINKIPLLLNLGFAKEPESNSDLNEFEKKFIQFY